MSSLDKPRIKPLRVAIFFFWIVTSFSSLVYLSTAFVDISWNHRLMIAFYVALIPFGVLLLVKNPELLEKSKKLKGSKVSLLGPILMVLFMPLLVSSSVQMLLAFVEIRLMRSEVLNIEFTQIHLVPTKNGNYYDRNMYLRDESGVFNFVKTVRTDSELAKAPVVYGKVINGLFGNRYLLELSGVPIENN